MKGRITTDDIDGHEIDTDADSQSKQCNQESNLCPGMCHKSKIERQTCTSMSGGQGEGQRAVVGAFEVEHQVGRPKPAVGVFLRPSLI